MSLELDSETLETLRQGDRKAVRQLFVRGVTFWMGDGSVQRAVVFYCHEVIWRRVDSVDQLIIGQTVAQ
jgi:hypothetical protein